jgi:hypothetical protein
MQHTHFLYFWKIWDRGVDIGVGIITSVMIAVIGLLFWRGKLWLDLRAEEQKQLQQHRIAAEIEDERNREEAQQRHEGLKFERERLAKAVEAAPDLQSQAVVWEHFVKSMEDHNLDHRTENLPQTRQRAQFTTVMAAGRRHEAPPERQAEMAAVIRATSV